jgi:hypothetical protein
MGVASCPASGGGGLSSVVKSLQTGTASSSGTITISAVNTAKTFVYATSTGSAGTVAASGSINAANGSTSGISFSSAYGSIDNYMAVASVGNQYSGFGTISALSANGSYSYFIGRYSGASAASYASVNQFMNAMNTNGANVSMNSTSLTGGTTSGLYSASYGATLTNSTTITVTGPCTYQVIEYY